MSHNPLFPSQNERMPESDRAFIANRSHLVAFSDETGRAALVAEHPGIDAPDAPLAPVVDINTGHELRAQGVAGVVMDSAAYREQQEIDHINQLTQAARQEAA